MKVLLTDTTLHTPGPWKPKTGERVCVCYDGKLGRVVEGRVLQTRGCFIKVRFDEWVGEAKGIEQWFPRISPNEYGAFVKVQDSVMKGLLGLPGDWYSVYPSPLCPCPRCLGCSCGEPGCVNSENTLCTCSIPRPEGWDVKFFSDEYTQYAKTYPKRPVAPFKSITWSKEPPEGSELISLASVTINNRGRMLVQCHGHEEVKILIDLLPVTLDERAKRGWNHEDDSEAKDS